MTLRRREALIAAGAACVAKPVASGTTSSTPGRLLGADAALGHRLRTGDIPEPTQTERAEVVIVGGGVAGLSAAWWLRRAGVDGVRIVELEDDVGGNAASGRNGVSRYPWGAHYVPLLTAEFGPRSGAVHRTRHHHRPGRGWAAHLRSIRALRRPARAAIPQRRLAGGPATR